MTRSVGSPSGSITRALSSPSSSNTPGAVSTQSPEPMHSPRSTSMRIRLPGESSSAMRPARLPPGRQRPGARSSCASGRRARFRPMCTWSRWAVVRSTFCAPALAVEADRVAVHARSAPDHHERQFQMISWMPIRRARACGLPARSGASSSADQALAARRSARPARVQVPVDGPALGVQAEVAAREPLAAHDPPAGPAGVAPEPGLKRQRAARGAAPARRSSVVVARLVDRHATASRSAGLRGDRTGRGTAAPPRGQAVSACRGRAAA